MSETPGDGQGQTPNEQVGWSPDEVRLDEATRRSRLRWVVVVDGALPAGLAVNAAACLAASSGAAVTGLVGPGGHDADGGWHPGLPWAGCTVLAATAQELVDLRAKATAGDGVLVSDVPASAQTNRVYADYLGELARSGTPDLGLRAVSLLGPRNRIDKLTKGLGLLA
jgi:hypothetical protein